MPRRARLKSPFGIYHVMVRGINKQRIFDAPSDYMRYISILEKCIESHDIHVLAYCLMDNHVHLLLKDNDSLSSFMQSLGTKYAGWFNNKYGRVGHLFQDRFRSEAVTSDAYFLSVLRYIHNNPVKAEKCSAPSEYPYSSFRNYYNNPIIDTSIVDKLISPADFKRLHQKNNNPDESPDAFEHIDIDDIKTRKSDREALEIIKASCGFCTTSEFLKMNSELQRYWGKLLHSKGLAMRQINRLTGIPIGVLRNI